jgi:hypothetical protein
VLPGTSFSEENCCHTVRIAVIANDRSANGDACIPKQYNCGNDILGGRSTRRTVIRRQMQNRRNYSPDSCPLDGDAFT